MQIPDDIYDALDDASPQRIVVIGLGNADRADDRFGLAVAEQLRPLAVEQVFSEADRAVENIVIDLVEQQENPLVFFLDAADFGEQPGTLGLFGPEDAARFSPPFSTHKVPLPFLMTHIKDSGGTPYLLAVQPASLELFGGMTAAVSHAKEVVCSFFQTVFRAEDSG